MNKFLWIIILSLLLTVNVNAQRLFCEGTNVSNAVLKIYKKKILLISEGDLTYFKKKWINSHILLNAEKHFVNQKKKILINLKTRTVKFSILNYNKSSSNIIFEKNYSNCIYYKKNDL